MDNVLPILAPFIVLNGGAMIIFLCSAQRCRNFRPYIPALAFVVIFLALFTAFFCQGHPARADELASADGSLRLTAFSRITTYVGVIFGLILVLVSWNPDHRGVAAAADQTNPQNPSISAEYFALLLVALSGLLLTAVANNLIVLFLALEMVSMPTYALVALSRRHSQAKEAALKYFFLGALAAALLVYGFSFIYGLTGTIRLDHISDAITHGEIIHPQLFLLALVLVLVGLCFKIAAVPMHFYAADVYQGAACSVTALLAFLPKFAGFYVLFLLAGFVIYPLPENQAHIIAGLIWILAAATMIVGNVLALVQRNVKRILAYSSVTHSGYILLALLAWPYPDRSASIALVFYICAYALSTLGAFAILALMERNHDEVQQLSDLNGLSRQHPALAAGLTICIFSLMGMPLTAGFIGKFYVFSALFESTVLSQYWIIVLLIIALINIPIAAGYYLKIIAACYLGDEDFTPQIHAHRLQKTGIALAVITTIILGVAPNLLLKYMPKPATATPPIINPVTNQNPTPTTPTDVPAPAIN